jgi:hypothetical protein
MQKYQGNSTNAPRETFIGDQRHMLAYINPFEEDLLRNYGGTGQSGSWWRSCISACVY